MANTDHIPHGIALSRKRFTTRAVKYIFTIFHTKVFDLLVGKTFSWQSWMWYWLSPMCGGYRFWLFNFPTWWFVLRVFMIQYRDDVMSFKIPFFCKITWWYLYSGTKEHLFKNKPRCIEIFSGNKVSISNDFKWSKITLSL